MSLCVMLMITWLELMCDGGDYMVRSLYFICVDYITKWVEATACIDNDAPNIVNKNI